MLQDILYWLVFSVDAGIASSPLNFILVVASATVYSYNHAFCTGIKYCIAIGCFSRFVSVRGNTRIFSRKSSLVGFGIRIRHLR